MKHIFSHKMTFKGNGLGMALFGILPGMYLGGLTGVNVVSTFLGASPNAEVFKNLLAAGGMMVGITLGSALFAAIQRMCNAVLRKWIRKNGSKKFGVAGLTHHAG